MENAPAVNSDLFTICIRIDFISLLRGQVALAMLHKYKLDRSENLRSIFFEIYSLGLMNILYSSQVYSIK